MPAHATPEPQSSQELAWRLANPLLADLTTARIRELQAEISAARAKAQRASQDLKALNAWVALQGQDQLPFKD
jgi:hypothetical protein